MVDANRRRMFSKASGRQPTRVCGTERGSGQDLDAEVGVAIARAEMPTGRVKVRAAEFWAGSRREETLKDWNEC